MNQAHSPVPVTILTGDLGAGKTTLLNHLLAEVRGKNYAVIINEYGTIGIDNKLVEAEDSGEPILIGDGLICCKVRGDLIATVERILARPGKLDGILIEASGLANPIPVVQTFFNQGGMPEQAMVDAVVTVIDAKHFLNSLSENRETTEQVLAGDIIVLNKARLVSRDVLTAVRDRIEKMNPTAVLLQIDAHAVPVTQILGQGAFDVTRFQKLEVGPATRYDYEYSVGLEINPPLDMNKFTAWLEDFVGRHVEDTRRYKGILNVSNSDNRVIIHGVHSEMHGGIVKNRPWKPDERRTSTIVFIGPNLNRAEIEAGIASCIALPHPQATPPKAGIAGLTGLLDRAKKIISGSKLPDPSSKI